MFCGRHLLAAKLRPANIDASAGSVEEMARIVTQIRRRWPKVRILLRADSGFAREALMAWCENNDVDFLFGLARNSRLVAVIETELAAAQEQNQKTEKPAPKDRKTGAPLQGFCLAYPQQLEPRPAGRGQGGVDRRCGQSTVRRHIIGACRARGPPPLRKALCARGEMENRIKECQLDLYADRTPV